MGVIQRQGIKQSITNYAGTVIGALSTIFIYPNEQALYGLWLTLIGMAVLFWPFASFGFHALTIRFFPRFRNASKDHHGFLPFLLIGSLLSFSVFTVAVLYFKEPLLGSLTALSFDVSIVDKHIVQILAFTLFMLIQSILTNYISNFQRIVVPAIITNLWPKIALPTLVLLAWMGHLTVSQYVWGLLLMQFGVIAGQIFYLAFLGELRLRPRLDIFRSGSLREMGSYGVYGILGGLGSAFAWRIDHVMISMLLGLANTGIYGIAQFMGKSIDIPTKAIYAIAGPIIANAWEKGNLEEIQEIYQKSSLNLLILGLPMYAMVVLSVDDLFRLTSQYDSLKPAIMVVVLIGLGKVADMSFSVNAQILAFSRFYRVNLIAILILATLNLTLNYLLIPTIGIVGAAWASFVAITTHNVFRATYIWFKMRMQPFSWRTGVVVLLAVAASALTWIIPDSGSPIVNILMNFVFVILFYVPAVLKLHLSEDINLMYAKVVSDVKGRVGRKK